jgi:hypothetical protein
MTKPKPTNVVDYLMENLKHQAPINSVNTLRSVLVAISWASIAKVIGNETAILLSITNLMNGVIVPILSHYIRKRLLEQAKRSNALAPGSAQVALKPASFNVLSLSSETLMGLIGIAQGILTKNFMALGVGINGFLTVLSQLFNIYKNKKLANAAVHSISKNSQK